MADINEVIQCAMQTSLNTIKPIAISCVDAAVCSSGAAGAATSLHCGLQYTLAIINRLRS